MMVIKRSFIEYYSTAALTLWFLSVLDAYNYEDNKRERLCLVQRLKKKADNTKKLEYY